MIFGIILLAIAAILLVWFVAWFIITRVNGNCPLCAMEKIARPSKLTIDTTDAPNYGGATVPPMGWSSWNTFRQNINQDLILEVAEAMEASGLAEAGYNYINLDDCWHSSVRDEMGRLQGDLGTFSMGIPALIKQLNSRGFKVGLYSSNGTLTCEDLPASLGHERLDANGLQILAQRIEILILIPQFQVHHAQQHDGINRQRHFIPLLAANKKAGHSTK